MAARHLGWLVLAACSSGTPAPAPAPVAPPVTFTATKVVPGEHGVIEIEEINATDKEIAHYQLMYRFTDARGAVVQSHRRWARSDGTSSDTYSDFDSFSISGGIYMCDPKSTCHLTINFLEVPAGAVHAEVRAARLVAITRNPDGTVTNVEPPLVDRGTATWPSDR